jgi:hypothetical protein
MAVFDKTGTAIKQQHAGRSPVFERFLGNGIRGERIIKVREPHPPYDTK